MTRNRVLALILSVECFFIALNGQSQQPAAPPHSQGQLEVTVVDQQDKPLAGALVALPGHRCTTGAEGRCKFKVLPGRYALLVSKNGYRGRRVNAGVRPGELTTTRVVLEKLPPAPRR